MKSPPSRRRTDRKSANCWRIAIQPSATKAWRRRGCPSAARTQEHYHPRAEEIYYITHGTGRIRIEGELRDVQPGDAIAIPPGQKHKLWNTGMESLRLLCCCAPAYEHADTTLTET